MMIQSVTKAGKKLFVILILGITLLQSGCNKATKETQQKAEKADGVEEKKKTESGDWEEARTTPYGKYPETVTYTLAQMNGANNSNLPQGQTYENNEYTRYLKKMLNIQNENTYMESEDRYDEFVNVIVKDRMLPDVMVISDKKMLDEMVENDLIEDLTEVYEFCTTDRIKAMYSSYGTELLDSVKYDGKLMAMPETVIDHGPCLLWLRKDWMDKLEIGRAHI